MFFKKYAVTDRNTMGWYIEARTIKEIASHVNGAEQYVIAVEYGRPRPLTDKEEAELQLELAKQRSHWFWG